jgi:hypothetical protein
MKNVKLLKRNTIIALGVFLALTFSGSELLAQNQKIDPEIKAKWHTTKPGPPDLLGVTISKSEKFFDGYTFFVSFLDEEAKLVDMEGKVVHIWKRETGAHWHFAEMLPNGHVLVVSNERGYSVKRSGDQRVFELDWNSNLVWESFVTGHHDAERLANGNTLVVCNGNALYKELSDGPALYDYLQEVNPKNEVVWEWHFAAHVEEIHKLVGDISPVKPLGDYPHINTIESLPDNPLAQTDDRFKKGNLLISARHISVVFIIDKESGEIVWAWGPGDIVGQHEPTMLANGNILIFDNGRGDQEIPDRSYSRVVEINPLTYQTEWEYKTEIPEDFISYVGSGNQRLPNGNTLISAMNWKGGIGRIFEVTPENEIVWEYWNPFQERIYRAYRYPAKMVEELLHD